MDGTLIVERQDTLPLPLRRLPRLGFDGVEGRAGERVLAEETPVALTYDGATHAVMMASPTDLEDFGLGFSLTEGLVAAPDALVSLEVLSRGELGCEVRMYLAPEAQKAQSQRRRALAGPVGCGLCGIQSLAEAARTPRPVQARLHVTAHEVAEAMAALGDAQAMNHQAHAVHAAGFWQPGRGLVALREDVGRHNALDKLAGALARADVAGGTGIVAITSRVSVEMVQKAACIGAPILAAVSAPTALAVRMAEACGITLLAIARDRGFEAFTHPHRVSCVAA